MSTQLSVQLSVQLAVQFDVQLAVQSDENNTIDKRKFYFISLNFRSDIG